MTEEPIPPKPPRRLLSSGMPGADYGVFLLAAPLIGMAALVITAFAAHSLSGYFWLLALTAFVTALLAVLEIFQAPAAWDSGSPARLMGRWAAAILFLWPAGYPLYLRARKQLRLDDWMKAAVLVEILFLAGAVGAAAVTVTGYGTPPPEAAAAEEKDVGLLTADRHWLPDKDDIDIVKTGHLDTCPQKTLDREVSGYFETPRWDAGATADGLDFVNASGIVTYQDKPAVAVLQFVMNRDKSGFRYQAFTINGVPQPLYVAAFTLAQMCE
ncbi:MAG: hypothetical protein ACM3ZT_03815 [Bacillota bacterium]